MIAKPAVVPFKYNLDGDSESSRQIATSSRELCSVLITATGTAVAARIYDSANGQGRKDQSILIAANTGESTAFCPAQPILMKNGIYLEFEQGAWAGGELYITYQ